METTTIEVTAEQRDYLKGMSMGSHKSALQELIDSYESGSNASQCDSDIGETLEEIKYEVCRTSQTAEPNTAEIMNRLDDLEAELPRKVAEELR